ncbi:hypothetical protein ST201phi2-1p011 [Pseudomonas phage 201phi2-1]|uniref:Uncharacterized protein n=1 Tax=Pseudomonas phage 201phi2-1 TaxID=198110 RepID=B3FJY7_BP201|nr:hypothetical protein ST201phi2-1p011 [Pseudomonas phage 201phi2-1]ABY62845.1 hypothetical protein 201phi2-1p011 [Pseudomonas phage 201phi2-1]
MGKSEIADKVAKNKASKDRWEFIQHVVRLLAFWPLQIVLTANILVTTYGILVQDISNDLKTIWVVTQNWPIIVTWVIIYYCIRRENKWFGW